MDRCGKNDGVNVGWVDGIRLVGVWSIRWGLSDGLNVQYNIRWFECTVRH